MIDLSGMVAWLGGVHEGGEWEKSKEKTREKFLGLVGWAVLGNGKRMNKGKRKEKWKNKWLEKKE